MGDKEVRSQVTMEEFFEWLGVSVPESGFIKCPAHRDESPSLKVYGKDKGWYCFSCLRGGGPVEFLVIREQISFMDAKKKLIDAFHLEKTGFSLKFKRDESHFSEIVEEWHRRFLVKIWNSLNSIPKNLQQRAIDSWLDYGPGRVQWACEAALQLKSLGPIEWVSKDIIRFMRWYVEEEVSYAKYKESATNLPEAS